MKQCWADILGGCSEIYSNEHYVGRGALFANKKVKTRGLHRDLDGRSIHVSDLQAHILCKTHNSNLSDVDNEAINLKNVLEQLLKEENKDDLLEGSGLWTPTQHKVSGRLIGRWLCKLHCNFVTLKGVDPPEYYVHHAFGMSIDPTPRFYMRAQFNDVFSYQQRIRYFNYPSGPCKENEYGTFHVFFMGFHFLVCPYDLTEPIKAKLTEVSGDQSYLMNWMEKLDKIAIETEGIITKSITFDWSDGNT